MDDFETVRDALHYYGDEIPNDPVALADALAALDRIDAEVERLRAWGQQVHDALDGKPLPEHPDEAPARIERLRSRDRQWQAMTGRDNPAFPTSKGGK
jgi:hypothetical protein